MRNGASVEGVAARILGELRRHPEATQTDLAAATGLSQPTVSRAVRRLVRDGWVRAAGEGTSAAGRRPRLLQVNPAVGLAAGADVGESFIRAFLADGGGRVVAEAQVPTGARPGGEGAVARLVEAITGLVARAGLSAGRLLGLVVAVPGIVDGASGRIVATPHIQGWDGLPLADRLRSAFPAATVHVENDVNLAALGEYAAAPLGPGQSLAFVNIRSGVGAGLVVDGQLYRGAHGAAGEIGFLSFDPGYAFARHAGLGYLERSAGGRSLVDAARRHLRRRRVLRRATPAGDDVRPPALPSNVYEAVAALRAIGAGPEVAAEFAGVWALAVANLVSVVDPDRVVLGGPALELDPALPAHIARIVQRLVPFPPPIDAARLGSDAAARGALHEALALMERRLLEALDGAAPGKRPEPVAHPAATAHDAADSERT